MQLIRPPVPQCLAIIFIQMITFENKTRRNKYDVVGTLLAGVHTHNSDCFCAAFRRLIHASSTRRLPIWPEAIDLTDK